MTHSLSAEGCDASEDGTGRGTPLVADPITASFAKHHGASGGKDSMPRNMDHVAAPLTAGGTRGSNAPGRRKEDDENLVCFAQNQREEVREMPVAGSLPAIRRGDAKNESLLAGSSVRRLTPRECERLQGFPDDYTLIPYRGKPASDTARYRALGNSMAVPVMRWIGKRINRLTTQDRE